MRALGIDAGFSSMGWAIAELQYLGSIKPITCGVISTEKSNKKQNVKATEDSLRRGQELYYELSKLIAAENINLICTETMSWPRNAGVVAKMGIAWGWIASVAHRYSLPLVQATPMEIKRAVTGDGKSSKERMIATIQRLFPSLTLPHQLGLQEHAADAVGAIIACQNSTLMKFAMSQSNLLD